MCCGGRGGGLSTAQVQALIDASKNVLLQKTALSSDVTSNTTVSGLAVTTLTVGKRYMLIMQVKTSTPSPESSWDLIASHNGSNILFNRDANSGGGTSTSHVKGNSCTFIAETSSISFTTQSYTSGDVLHGDGSYNETFIEVHELNMWSN